MKKIVCVLLVIVLLCGLVGCIGNGTLEKTGDNPDDKQTTEKKEQVLVDNEDVKVTFIEIFEEPSISNICYLRLKFENKSNKTVWFFLKDSYVNDMAQMMGTGVPIILESGKSSQQPFFFGYENLGITQKSEISKIQFKICGKDDETNDTVFETESLIINIT